MQNSKQAPIQVPVFVFLAYQVFSSFVSCLIKVPILQVERI